MTTVSYLVFMLKLSLIETSQPPLPCCISNNAYWGKRFHLTLFVLYKEIPKKYHVYNLFTVGIFARMFLKMKLVRTHSVKMAFKVACHFYGIYSVFLQERFTVSSSRRPI